MRVPSLSTTTGALIGCAALCGVLLGGAARADGLTPESYLDIERKVRLLTISGMQQRLFLLGLQSGEETEDQTDLDDEINGLVLEVYAEAGTSAGEHAAYGSRESDAIDAWLEDNEGVAVELDTIAAEFERLIDEIDSRRAR